MMVDIKNNLKTVENRIAEAAKRVGRNPDEVKLIAVSKTKPVDDINEAIKCGVTDIGENKVQEVMDKYDAAEPVNWHFIGHLQRNKVKYIIDKVTMIHSIDSLRLAMEINNRASAKNIIMDVLIQINPAGEDSKFGISPEETQLLIEDILKECPAINIRGLMCVVPAADNPDDVRVYFKKAKELFDNLGSVITHERFDMEHLSMGMTHDFETAIEEGSTMVRVGTAIFGERNYSK